MYKGCPLYKDGIPEAELQYSPKLKHHLLKRSDGGGGMERGTQEVTRAKGRRSGISSNAYCLKTQILKALSQVLLKEALEMKMLTWC